jgi:hypothetical protein
MLTLQKNNLNTLFEVLSSRAKTPVGILLCEWSDNFCITTIYEPAYKTISELKYFTFDLLTEGVISEILTSLQKDTPFSRVYIGCSFPQSLLVPKRLYNENVDLLTPIYGPNYKETINEFIGEWQLYNTYALPVLLFERLQQSFTSIQFIHTYTASLKTSNGFHRNDQVNVNFTPKNFSIIIRKMNQVLLAQMYYYHSHLDVIYYLLKIFQELGLDNNSTQIILSGLVDKDSPMYKEILSYFLNVTFPADPDITLEGNPHPPHFFTSVFNLAACVL